MKSPLLTVYFSAPGSLQSLATGAAKHAAISLAQEQEWVSRKPLLDEADAQIALIDEQSCNKLDQGADIFYSLHQRRVPVLCLVEKSTQPPQVLLGNHNPLLTIVEFSTREQAEQAIDNFLAPPVEPGRIFVIEGGDGAGKQTQTAALIARLRSEGYPVATMDFPHDSAMHGKLIRTLLSGAMGDIKSVNPLLFASLYAQNRFDVSPILRHWICRGVNVVLDRYVEANYGHQASKLPADERPILIEQLSRFEHDWLDIPRVILTSPAPPLPC